jgi:hypothetical protein
MRRSNTRGLTKAPPAMLRMTKTMMRSRSRSKGVLSLKCPASLLLSPAPHRPETYPGPASDDAVRDVSQMSFAFTIARIVRRVTGPAARTTSPSPGSSGSLTARSRPPRLTRKRRDDALAGCEARTQGISAQGGGGSAREDAGRTMSDNAKAIIVRETSPLTRALKRRTPTDFIDGPSEEIVLTRTETGRNALGMKACGSSSPTTAS